MTKKTLQIDFDGTIARYTGWNGRDDFGEPLPEARRAMCILARKYRLVCFTARDNIEGINNWLRRHGFPQMHITNKKDPAFCMIDDRAITFTGSWNQQLLDAIDNFHPWWEAAPEHDPSSHQSLSTASTYPVDQTQQPPASPPLEPA